MQGIADRVGFSIDIDERFRERDFAADDVVVADRLAAMLAGFDNPDFAFPDGESTREVKLRGILAMNQVLNKYSGKRVAIGIHGGIMAPIMGHYDPQFDADFLRKLPKPDIYQFTFKRKGIG